MFSLPENLKIIEGLPPTVGAAAPLTADYISVKNYHKVYIVVHYHQGDADDQTWAPERATAVAPTGNVALANAVRIWSNLDCEASDTLVERAAAVNYASGAALKHKQVIFEINCEDLGAGYDVIGIATSGNVAATSCAEVMYYCLPRVASRVATQPSGIVD